MATLERILEIWRAGGWVMLPLLAICLTMFFVGVRLWLSVRGRGGRMVEERTWMEWVVEPRRGEGWAGEVIRYTQDEVTSVEDIHRRFSEVAVAELGPVDRQLAWLGTLVAAAPLVGLLGTVLGMLVTFQALAAGGGGGQVTEAMAAGISQALFPPEVGLCIALPGLILIQVIRRRRAEFEAFLARLESVTTQRFNRAGTLGGGRPSMAPGA
ncbi:MAG: MotA/TolQ/ExbB proton channel family protein [Verrucomicrobiae bacterium]|nr:MotA/TolQ/ExbB proton channel family protein [Verrucomicrobiae bacterium]